MTTRIEKNLPINDYHAAEGISNSGISLILDCPARYYYEYLGEQKSDKFIFPDSNIELEIEPDEDDKKEKEWGVIGNALHTLVLEPNNFFERYCLLPKLDRRRTEDKNLYNALMQSGKILLSPKQAKTAFLMANSIKRHEKFSKVLAKGGNIEHSFFYESESGVTLRCRPDFYNDFMIVDVKTTQSVAPGAFQASIAEYGYHRQAAINLDLVSQITGKEYKYFGIIAVEKTWPHFSEFYLIDKNSIEIGRREYLTGVETYRICKERNVWPTYTDGLQEIQLPNWYKTKF